MRDYQPKSNKYILPRNLYRQTLYQIRDYPRLKDECDAIAESITVQMDGMPRGSDVGNPTEQKALKRQKYMDIIDCIDRAKKEIPQEYMQGVWLNILYEKPYPPGGGIRTYARYKSKFVYCVAKNLFLI